MEVSQIIAGIDAQIKKLIEARNILDSMSVPAVKSGRGRPKGSKNAAAAAPAAKSVKSVSARTVAAPKTAPAAKPAKNKRQLSPEGRKRIADAMKRRWAERRRETGK